MSGKAQASTGQAGGRNMMAGRRKVERGGRWKEGREGGEINGACPAQGKQMVRCVVRCVLRCAMLTRAPRSSKTLA